MLQWVTNIMKPPESTIGALAIAMAMALALHVSLEGVDVNIEHDKAFDFTSVRTWAWSPKGAGDVIDGPNAGRRPGSREAKGRAADSGCGRRRNDASRSAAGGRPSQT